MSSHNEIDRLPMYYAWSLIPVGMRIVFCQFALHAPGGAPLTDQDIHFIADLEWPDIEKETQRLIMRFMRQSAIAKYKMLDAPGRIKFTPIEKPAQPSELEKTWQQ